MRFKVKVSGYIHAMRSIDFDDFCTWLCKRNFHDLTLTCVEVLQPPSVFSSGQCLKSPQG
jgi:hypothetical protein